jgi:8-oxo-dGTP diphosphatase
MPKPQRQANVHLETVTGIFCLGGSSPQPELEVMTVPREDLGRGARGLPGGTVGADEDLEDAARRTVEEQAGIATDIRMDQVEAFGAPDRDPHGRVVAIGWTGLAFPELRGAKPAVAGAEWRRLSEVGELGGDHEAILEVLREDLRRRARDLPLAVELVAENFPLSTLRRAYEALLGRALDKRNFRRKALATGLFEPTGLMQADVAHRPASLYTFAVDRYLELDEQALRFGF